MPTITQSIEITTNGTGAYSQTQVFNPPGPFSIKVKELKVKLLAPPVTTITGTVDVDAADGNPQNPAQDFKISTGEEIALGTWNLDGGDNIFLASGQTTPSRPDTLIQLEIQATF